ncbi:2-polyprenyl-3-methyl-5-hydroxy-6-metoxy-1,4-benzoquinol methylase [Marinobacter daqiaonensis]|uniref:2-polyprenyl-3-methyl-5-hydroxy-6-metoxy-1,4-benzoquinol methylase n=1 Tax=Marinobacter daqiaonensis TaxID=650891 RepID=A0A1I6JBD4_9GAMM|nr:class I SAM-dependent methyltransferase [Marinobacter daqiaonensis]SFR76259.1 2-polyprenyl-3-methyl-5-hydroxy-6-metoxy-1,4-benzoquinol methylase [Marinobacter daqiaonensis]
MTHSPIPARTTCTVCQGDRLQLLATVDHRVYRRCVRCEATLMDPAGWLPEDEEREIYRLHDNAVDDPGYRRFLDKLAEPLMERLAAGQQGLDFGCGPGPALADMLAARGLEVTLYDPAFFPDPLPLARQWDFVTCTEVVEHLKDPYTVFGSLGALLKPGGTLGVMTCFQTDDNRFAGWHYRRDPTHIVFYREKTFHWLADHFGWHLTIPRKDVVLLQPK